MHHKLIANKKSIYLLPNALTTAALFCGFLAIIASSNGQYVKAVISIIFAAIFDGLDGRVARLTKSQSNFGEIYDSLADMISFGAAPAMLAYFWSLQNFGQLGSAAVFVYLAGTAMRLARFTSNDDETNTNYFSGLPSPAAALSIVSFIWVMEEYSVSTEWIIDLLLILVPTIGLIMVSNIPYYSFKKITIRKKMSFTKLAAPVLLLCAVLLFEPVLFMLLVFWGYVVSYPCYFVVRALLRQRNRDDHLIPLQRLKSKYPNASRKKRPE